MTPEYLVQQTQSALSDQSVLQILFHKCFEYDSWIKEEFQGNYDILPETIYPFQITPASMVSIVKIRATRDGRQKLYSFLFVFAEQGLTINLTHPGESNSDPVLFRDIYSLARASASAQLASEEIILKDTIVVGSVAETGWSERWIWISRVGQTTQTEISFSATVGKGIVFNLKAA